MRPASRPTRDRWSFAEDVAPSARGTSEDRPSALDFDKEDQAPQRHEGIDSAPAQAFAAPRDFLFAAAEETAAPPQAKTAPSWPMTPAAMPPPAPIPAPARENPRQSFAPTPSHWARIEVPEADRARAAAAGVERYMDDNIASRSHATRRSSRLAVAAILLLAGVAAIALYRFADPQGPAGPQNAVAPRAEQSAAPQTTGVESPAPPARPSPSDQSAPARDAPLIEVAP